MCGCRFSKVGSMYKDVPAAAPAAAGGEAGPGYAAGESTLEGEAPAPEAVVAAEPEAAAMDTDEGGAGPSTAVA